MKISTRTCDKSSRANNRKCWYWDRPLVNFCSCIKGYTSTIVLKQTIFLWFWKVLCTDSNAVKQSSFTWMRQKWLTTLYYACQGSSLSLCKKIPTCLLTHLRLNMYYSQIWFVVYTKIMGGFFKDLHFKTLFQKFSFSGFQNAVFV